MRDNQLKKLAKNLSDTAIMGKVVARKTNTLLTAAKKTPASFEKKLQKHEHTIKEVLVLSFIFYHFVPSK